MNNGPPSLERLRLPHVAPLAPKKMSRPPRHQVGERFLKGPIPLPWLGAAACLPGRALHVALAVWFLAGLRRSSQVKLGHAALALFGVKRHAGARGLKALEGAKLVSVARQIGKAPDVTLLSLKLEGQDVNEQHKDRGEP